MKIRVLFSVFAIGIIFCGPLHATLTPFGNEFTYQGRLSDGGQYDIAFGLYDAGTGGSRTVTVTNTNVAVTNGMFERQIGNAFKRFLNFLERSSRSFPFSSIAL